MPRLGPKDVALEKQLIRYTLGCNFEPPDASQRAAVAGDAKQWAEDTRAAAHAALDRSLRYLLSPGMGCQIMHP